MKTAISLNKQVSHQEIISTIDALIQKFMQEKGSQDLSGSLIVLEIKDCVLSLDDSHIPKIEHNCST